jgi:hypothetical protein
MKKKILGGIALLTIAAVAAWNVDLNSQRNELSAVSLANVEALAGESSGHCMASPNYYFCDTEFNGYYCSPCGFWGF